jgi:hypothetical protein
LTVWVDAFLDVPPASASALRTFWSSVTGWPPSGPRGDHGQFRSLLPEPPGSRAYLRVQELAAPARVHLDLVTTPSTAPAMAAEAARLAGLGAARLVSSRDDVEILASPAGQVFCLVRDDEPRPAVDPGRRARTWPGGHRSRVTHVCLDVPPAAYDAEVAFWVAATGWVREPTQYAEFEWVTPPPERAADVPLRLLVQRLSRPDDVVGAHLDLGTTDVPAEVDRLLAIGAVDRGAAGNWHVLADPVVGRPFCVTTSAP